MKREEFDSLVKELETKAAANPKSYTVRVGLLAGLGYGYLLLVLVGSLALTLGMIALMIAVPNGLTIKLGIIVLIAAGGLAWALIKGLWVRMEPPEGIRLTEQDAPALFKELRKLEDELGAPHFHDVLLVGEYNAAVVQIPRLGIFGWHRNYLLVGFALLQGLSVDEFRSVLAHELGHLSGNHARFGNWLYRQRRSWERVFEQIARQNQGKSSVVLSSFVDWFWPKFNAHAFVLSRANEYEADSVAARLAGADAAASALVKVSVHSSFLEESFWPAQFNQASTLGEPPAQVYSALSEAMARGGTAEENARWVKAAFLIETNNTNTHPCLRDRLRSLGRLPEGIAEKRFPETVAYASSPTAAEQFLGAALPALSKRLSDEWAGRIKEPWAKRHTELVERRKELEKTEQLIAEGENVDTLWTKARLLLEVEGEKQAEPILSRILELKPAHPHANFVRGRQLLEMDDASGVDFMERALQSDPTLTRNGADVLYAHYARTGQRDRMKSLEERIERHAEVEKLAMLERQNVKAGDHFEPPMLIPPVVARIREVASAENEIQAVYAARKACHYFPDSPAYVIGVEIAVSWYVPRSSEANSRLVQRLLEKVDVGGYLLVFVIEKELKPLGESIRKVPGSLVYQRAAS